MSPVSFTQAVTHHFVDYGKMKSICKDLGWDEGDSNWALRSLHVISSSCIYFVEN